MITVGVMDYLGEKKLDCMSVIVENTQTSAVYSVTADTESIKLYGDRVSVPNACLITVYDADGRSVLSATGTELDLSSLPKGIYVVKAEGYKRLKFTK